jgi:hypothetical protein
MKLIDLFGADYLDEHSTRSSAMGAPGTLKAKISRLYGGSVTCAKTEKLKNRRGATAHDKAQANWFQNMNCGGASSSVAEEAAGVGLVVPGVNMPAGMHPDEIRRQAKKWGFKVSARGVPPVARTDGKLDK